MAEEIQCIGLRIPVECLGDLLQLPKGARVVRVVCTDGDFERNTVSLIVEGIGPMTKAGCMIPVEDLWVTEQQVPVVDWKGVLKKYEKREDTDGSQS